MTTTTTTTTPTTTTTTTSSDNQLSIFAIQYFKAKLAGRYLAKKISVTSSKASSGSSPGSGSTPSVQLSDLVPMLPYMFAVCLVLIVYNSIFWFAVNLVRTSWSKQKPEPEPEPGHRLGLWPGQTGPTAAKSGAVPVTRRRVKRIRVSPQPVRMTGFSWAKY